MQKPNEWKGEWVDTMIAPKHFIVNELVKFDY